MTEPIHTGDLDAAYAGEAAGTPFSLTCTECDAGDDVGSVAEAVERGWTRIYFDPTGLSWNFVAFCPQCTAEENGRLFA